MSTSVIVTGLPGDSKFTKLVYTFKNIFKRIQIKKFWIRELQDLYDSDFKQMTVEFLDVAEARKARNYLDNLTFTQGQGNYMLMATLEDESMPPEEYHEEERDWRRNRRPGKRGRARSRSPSPRYAREANKLDMEIELLRKQRQVIEEERRLLVEQKKLDMIREYGPSASRDFDRFEAPRKRQQPPEPVQVKPKRKRSSPPPKANGVLGLPQFFQPCKKLIADMKQYIETDTTPEEVEILIRLIRATIRKNLAISLDGKDYMPTGEIMKLYRELHPKTTDAAFVAKILSNIRASYLPYKIRVKPDPDALGEKSDGNEVGNDGKMEIKAENDLKKTGSEKEQPGANEVGIDGAVGKEVEKDSVEKTGNEEETQPDANGVGSGNTEKVEKDENQTEGAKVQESCEDNKAANDETEPHEKPVNEENGTDFAPTAGITVKCKPDLLQEEPEEISSEVSSDRGDVTGVVGTSSEG